MFYNYCFFFENLAKITAKFFFVDKHVEPQGKMLYFMKKQRFLFLHKSWSKFFPKLGGGLENGMLPMKKIHFFQEQNTQFLDKRRCFLVPVFLSCILAKSGGSKENVLSDPLMSSCSDAVAIKNLGPFP